ncbi:hypothetical protein [Nocardia sp. IFM 10818]
MREPQDLPDEVIAAMWGNVGPDIDRALERVRSIRAYRNAPGSVLAGDDAACSPSTFSVHTAVGSCLSSGMDHLHALKSHVVDGPMLHISSPFSLARGALENLSIAYWILHPAERADRVQRALRWWAQNFKDAERALRPAGGIEDGATESALLELEEVARRSANVIPVPIRKGHTSTEAVKYADQHAVEARQVLFAWQLCSGFAHGRGWAIHGMSSAESIRVADQDEPVIQLSPNDTAIVFVTLTSLCLASETFRILDQKAGEASD